MKELEEKTRIHHVLERPNDEVDRKIDPFTTAHVNNIEKQNHWTSPNKQSKYTITCTTPTHYDSLSHMNMSCLLGRVTRKRSAI
jgi:hypothetical protein